MEKQLLKTEWHEKVGEKPLQEYPRPQFVRESYLNLNGVWEYAITSSADFPFRYDGKILVPFSPESQLSGVMRQLEPNKFLHYYRTFYMPKSFNKGVVLLHFGAVDSCCEVYVDDVLVGKHNGGFTSFSFDITSALNPCETHILWIVVTDETEKGVQATGKQRLKRGGMWYTAQSGIWQSVWVESVAPSYIKSAKITPCFDDACIYVELEKTFDDTVTAMIFDGDKEIAYADGKGDLRVKFPNGNFTPWTPENPHLYTLKLISRRDRVTCYFAMRKFSVEKVGKYNRFMLNGKPYFLKGILNQGYWSDGLYTAPTDEALLYDVNIAKSAGFNCIRMHQKVECARWYYHCDKCGIIVWQDIPSGCFARFKLGTTVVPFLGFTRLKDSGKHGFVRKKGKDEFTCELTETVQNLYNVPSVAVWGIFNEGWGQFDADRFTDYVKQLDGTRLVDQASGWHAQKHSDFVSQHVYCKPFFMRRAKNKITAITEFGGFSLQTENCFCLKRCYGYKKCKNADDYNKALQKLFQKTVFKKVARGLSAYIYTQLSDVEEEINGIVTFDRRIVKVNCQLLKEINEKIQL